MTMADAKELLIKLINIDGNELDMIYHRDPDPEKKANKTYFNLQIKDYIFEKLYPHKKRTFADISLLLNNGNNLENLSGMEFDELLLGNSVLDITYIIHPFEVIEIYKHLKRSLQTRLDNYIVINITFKSYFTTIELDVSNRTRGFDGSISSCPIKIGDTFLSIDDAKIKLEDLGWYLIRYGI